MRAYDRLKYSTPTMFLYNLYLRYMCRRVKKYIFVATTGRSGTASLSNMFSQFPNVISMHEPYPIMFMDLDSRKDMGLDKRMQKRKMINIRRASRYYDYYLETNHRFIKRFHHTVLEELKKRAAVIHLVRNPEDVARSFHAIGSIPGETENGRRYLLSPFEQGNLIDFKKITDDTPRFNDGFYKCLWYWYEIEERIKAAKKTYSRIQWHKLNTEDLNNYDQLAVLAASLGLRDLDLSRLKFFRTNLKAHQKKDRGVARDKAVEMNKDFYEALVRLNQINREDN